MSSKEFKTIYKNAAAVVRARLSNRAGIKKLLDALGKRIPKEHQDPKTHRDLFFEPSIDAQQIGVPAETAEAAAVLLHKMGILRLWVRVTCPDVEDHEVGTILETDDPTEFESLSATCCDHCGRHHDLGWENCETLYAINTDQNHIDQQFDYNLLKSRILEDQKLSSRNVATDKARCEILTEQVRFAEPPAKLLTVALNSNRRLQDVPAPRGIWQNAWTGPIVVLVLYLVGIVRITRLAGERIAWGVTVVVLIVVFLVIRGQVQAKLAPTVLQRSAMICGFPISACCLTAGATGLHLKAAAGDGTPWWTQVDYGETSPLMILVGALLFISVLAFVWALDYRRGWFQGESPS